MLRDAMEQGARDAATKFGGLIDGGIDMVRRGLLGMAPEAFVQGRAAFSAGGAMHPGQVFWPKMPGHPWQQAAARGGTLLAATQLPGMIRSDPEEGTAARVLGGVGGLAGLLYGGQAGGLLGAPIGMALGRRIGHGIGHMF